MGYMLFEIVYLSAEVNHFKLKKTLFLIFLGNSFLKKLNTEFKRKFHQIAEVSEKRNKA